MGKLCWLTSSSHLLVSILTLVNSLSLTNFLNWPKFSFNHCSLPLMEIHGDFRLEQPMQCIWSSSLINQVSNSGVGVKWVGDTWTWSDNLKDVFRSITIDFSCWSFSKLVVVNSIRSTTYSVGASGALWYTLQDHE